jgi:hypothetical protein
MPANSPHPTAHTLRGWITAEYIPYKGKKLGPYYVRRWKQNGKLHRQYIKPSDLEKVKAACQNHRQKRTAQSQCAKELTIVAGNLNYLLKMIKRSLKGLLRPEDHDHLAILETQGPNVPGRPNLRLPKSSIAFPGDVPRSQQRQVRKSKPTKDFMVPSNTKQAANATSQIPSSEFQARNERSERVPSSTPEPATEQPKDSEIARCLAQLPNSQSSKNPQGLHQLDLSQAKPKRKHVTLWKWIPNPWENQNPTEKPFYNRIQRRLSKDDPNLIIEHRTQSQDRRTSRPPPGWRPNPDAKRSWDD